MTDNFNLKKFLSENKTIQNSNPFLREESTEDKEAHLDAEKDDAAHIADLEKDMKDDEKLDEADNHPSEVFTDAELDMASEMLMDMFDKLGLENNVEKSDALVKYINGWFATTDFVNESNHPSEVFTDAELDMASEMLMDMFDKLGLENNVEKSDALVKYINGWFETTDFVNEAEKVEVEAEEEVEVEAEETDDVEIDAPEMEGDEGEILSHLMKALGMAKSMDDEKLTKQIGNTVTFLTRQYISGE